MTPSPPPPFQKREVFVIFFGGDQWVETVWGFLIRSFGSHWGEAEGGDVEKSDKKQHLNGWYFHPNNGSQQGTQPGMDVLPTHTVFVCFLSQSYQLVMAGTWPKLGNKSSSWFADICLPLNYPAFGLTRIFQLLRCLKCPFLTGPSC